MIWLLIILLMSSVCYGMEQNGGSVATLKQLCLDRIAQKTYPTSSESSLKSKGSEDAFSQDGKEWTALSALIETKLSQELKDDLSLTLDVKSLLFDETQAKKALPIIKGLADKSTSSLTESFQAEEDVTSTSKDRSCLFLCWDKVSKICKVDKFFQSMFTENKHKPTVKQIFLETVLPFKQNENHSFWQKHAPFIEPTFKKDELAVFNCDDGMYVWNITQDRSIATLPAVKEVKFFDLYDSLFLIGTPDNKVSIWQVDSENNAVTKIQEKKLGNELAFATFTTHDTKPKILSCCQGNGNYILTCWNIADGKVSNRFIFKDQKQFIKDNSNVLVINKNQVKKLFDLLKLRNST